MKSKTEMLSMSDDELFSTLLESVNSHASKTLPRWDLEAKRILKYEHALMAELGRREHTVLQIFNRLAR